MGKLHQKLSKEQEDVLYLLTKEFLTIKQTALRRKTTVQAVYKTVNKLKKKGYLKIGFKGVEKIQTTFKPPRNQIRLHAQEFNIKILYKDEKYKKILKNSNLLNIDGNTIRLYNNSLEIYSGNSFYSDDTQKATVNSLEYWNKFFIRLENDLKIIFIKPRSQNIRLVNQHYAEVNNELAEEYEKKAEKIRVYTNDDGKLWFLIDNSFNLHEAETLHPKEAQRDMRDIVKPFFNDLRDNRPPLPSEMNKYIQDIVVVTKGIQDNQLIFDKNMKSHIKAIKELGIGIREMNKLIKERQKRLSEF